MEFVIGRMFLGDYCIENYKFWMVCISIYFKEYENMNNYIIWKCLKIVLF